MPQFWSRVETENGLVGLVKIRNLVELPEPSPKKHKPYLDDSD